ncbi:MAG: hypothetical protein E7662_04705 [Ruminococcaceae bacterium]|nr:hypothetical protein [Oscillospiraceae bacterium]
MSCYEIRRTDGKPALYQDGTRTVPILYGLSDIPGSAANTAQAQRNIAAFAAAGIHMVDADTGLHLGWRKNSPFDPEALRAEIGAVLDADPQSKVMLRLHLNPPYWWLRDNPDECIIYRTPEGDVPGIDDGESDRLIRGDNAMHMRVSLASEKWMREATELMEQFFLSLKGTPEGDALMAVQVACGLYGEWHQWGCDTGKPAQKRFRRWLREKYKTEEALQRAWNQPDVTFETAEYHPEPFRPCDDGMFRDPQLSMNTIDSQRCNQQIPPEAILHFCRAVKRIMPHLLCGSFYAYYFGVGSPEISGHLRPEMLYDDDSVDFLCGPFCYYKECRSADGAALQRGVLESIRLHGKLWLTEMDQHPEGIEIQPGGTPEYLAENIATLRRCTLQPLLAGHGFWYYDHRVVPTLQNTDTANTFAVSIYRKKGWWESADMMDEVAKIQSAAEKITQHPYRGEADVLLVYDTDSYYYTGRDIDYGGSRLAEGTVQLHHALMRRGIVYDSIYASDLDACEMDRYKCVIFVNCRMVTPQNREKFRRLTEGKLRIFLQGHGFCDGESLSEKHISSAVGMKIVRSAGTVPPTGEADMPKSAILTPLFCVQDADAEVLLRYENGEAAAAQRGNDVYVHLPYLPAQLVSALMSQAGVHIWCDSDEPVMAGGGFAVINCQRAGVRTLILPDGRRLSVSTNGYETVMYSTESGERIL